MSSPLRLAGAGDGAAAQELVERAFAHYVPRIGMRPGPMDWDYGGFARRGELWIAGEPLAGLLVLQEGPDHLWVEVVAVEPAAQGSGLGGELMRFAEEEARRRGHGEIRLLTHELMHENRAFYEYLGYEEYELRREEGFSRVYLRKSLPG